MPVAEPVSVSTPPRVRDDAPARSSTPEVVREAPAPSVRAQIRDAFVVDASPRPAPPVVSSAPRPAPAVLSPVVQASTALPAPTPVPVAVVTPRPEALVRPADVGGDTLVDYDDDEQTTAAPPARLRDGSDTLGIDDGADLFAAAHAVAARDEGTLMFDVARAPADAWTRDDAMRGQHTSDPFGGLRRPGGDTMPLDDLASPLAASAPDATRRKGRADMTLTPGREEATLPIVGKVRASGARPVPFAPVAPTEGGDTLPLEHPPIAAMTPIVPRVGAPPIVAPAPVVDRTAQLPAVADEGRDRGFYVKLAAATIAGGVVLGVIVTVLLR